jgi:hypothetical protein
METESSLRNAVLHIENRTMEIVQKHNNYVIYINVLGGKRRPARRADKLTSIYDWLMGYLIAPFYGTLTSDKVNSSRTSVTGDTGLIGSMEVACIPLNNGFEFLQFRKFV